MKSLAIIYPEDFSRVDRLFLDSLEKFNRNQNEIWIINDSEKITPPPIQGNIRIITHPFKYGWGGTQKTAFRYAIENQFDRVIALRLNSQVPGIGIEILSNHLDADPLAFHFLSRGKGFFSWIHDSFLNWISGTSLSGWRSHGKAFSTRAIKNIAFELNTFRDHFDSELLLQLHDANQILKFHLTSGENAALHFSASRFVNEIKSCLKFRLQKFGFLYDLRFHPETINKLSADSHPEKTYDSKFDTHSPHSLVLNGNLVLPESKILDIGCSTGYLSSRLAIEKKCKVIGVDMLSPSSVKCDDFQYIQLDLEKEPGKIADIIDRENINTVLMLDVLEHLSTPELFLLEIFKRKYKTNPTFVFSTGNVAFIGVRLMLLLGFFNYGEKGILDITHKRLFSYRTFKNLFEQTGFCPQRSFFFPLPVEKLKFSPWLGSLVEKSNRFLILLAPTLFSYQILIEANLLTPPADRKNAGEVN